MRDARAVRDQTVPVSVVRGMPAVAHGSVSAAELRAYGFRTEQVLDFSVNTNPLGPVASVLRAVAETDWSRYPGDDEPLLREALARHNRVAADQVVLGNGSVELMWLVALASLNPGDPASVVGPTFGEYARAIGVAGGRLVDAGAKLAFVCNPNNPTGQYRTRADIEQMAAGGALCVLDEAYVAFVDDAWDSADLLELGNVVILRSMTKDHALPGLRLGYALASPEIARAMESVKPPWSVNAGALRAGLAALEPDAVEHVSHARRVVRSAREMLTHGLQQRGFGVQPSAANFVLIEVGDGKAFRQALLPHGIVVRDCASFGMPASVRIACRPIADCERLLSVVGGL
jgi:histidinol-phosphate aminotransferase